MALQRLDQSSSPESPPGIDERRERHRGEARRAILDATEELLIESGGFGFSIRSLAKRCGYSAPTVYHYFGDKDGLIDALLEERVARLADEIESVPESGDPLSDLRELLLVFVRFGATNPTFRRLMWSVSGKGESRVTPAMERLRARVRPPLLELIAAGRFGDIDAETAGQLIWALLHGLSSIQVIEPEHPWTPQLGERAIDTLLRGMTHPARTEATR
jgi:AcrR family transcriptional regulator